MREAVKISYAIINSILIVMGLIIIVYGFKHRPNEPLGEHIPSANKLSHVYYPPATSPLAFLLSGIYINVLGTYGCFCLATAFYAPFIVYWIMVGIGIVLLSILYMFLFVIYTKQSMLIRQSVEEIMRKYETSEPDKRLMDAIQLLFNCCGKDDYHEWLELTGNIPSACCRPIIIKTPCNNGSNIMKTKGCTDELYKFLEAELRHQMSLLTFCSFLLIIAFLMALAIYTYEISPKK